MGRCKSTNTVSRCVLDEGHDGDHYWRGVRWRDPEPADALVERLLAVAARLLERSEQHRKAGLNVEMGRAKQSAEIVGQAIARLRSSGGTDGERIKGHMAGWVDLGGVPAACFVEDGENEALGAHEIGHPATLILATPTDTGGEDE